MEEGDRLTAPGWQTLADFLAKPETHGGAATEVIDTHTARVVLAGPRVWKLRRPVDYGWLDYGTRARRRTCAEAEIALNAPTAPGLYLGLGGLAPGPRLLMPGENLPDEAEPLVVMRRFEARNLFDRMAAEGRLDADLMRRTGAVVAAMHRRAPPTGIAPDFTGLAATLSEELEELAELLGGEDVARLSRLFQAAVERTAGVAAARSTRHCHGDLHLRNIVLWRGEPAPFDCVEFNDALSVIDPLYDLAFLLMDLLHRGRADLGAAALNAWAEGMAAEPGAEVKTAYGGFALMPLALALRAAVRAKVGALTARDARGTDAAARLEDARAYLAAASDHLGPRPEPRLIAIGGRSGSGKTTLARALAARLGAVVLRSDAIRKGLHGVAETERLPPEAYTREASAEVYEAMHARAMLAMSGGMTVILDAAHLDPAEREAAAEVARATGRRFDGLWLEGRAGALKERVAARQGDASDADVGVVAAQFARDTGAMHWKTLPAEDAPGLVTRRAMAMIGCGTGN